MKNPSSFTKRAFSYFERILKHLKIVVLLLFLTPSANLVNGQCGSGTSGDPFTSLDAATTVSSAGVYYFNLNGTAFSTYVSANGYVQVAIDFGDGVGNLPQGTALTNTTRGILTTAALGKLTEAIEVRLSSSTGNFDVVTTNSTIISRIQSNTTIHHGADDNAINNDWTGTNAAYITIDATCNSTLPNNLHQTVVHVCGQTSGTHWTQTTNTQAESLELGEISASAYLQLWVKGSALTNTLYVDADASGLNNGTSWANAFIDLQDALGSTLPCVTEIHVAAGTYKPTTGTDRTISFSMKNGITILGGYPNGGGTRNWTAYPTILSGDIGTAGSNSDNSYHVVSNSGLNSTAVLDGFRIEDGNADGTGTNSFGGGMNNDNSSPTITNCTFSSNSAGYIGGGMCNISSSPQITNCTFSGNTASDHGGGLYNNSSSPIITGSSFSNNTASNLDGGGMHNNSSSPQITNCIFSGNSASGNGGGMFNSSSSNPSVMNCTFSGNSAPIGGGMHNISSNPTVTNSIFWNNGTEIEGGAIVTYSIVQGGYTGTGNLNADPLFVNAASGDFHIQPCSPARDAGTDSGAPNTDFEGNARPFGGGYDMGADESTTVCCPSGNVVYVDANATGTNDGQSWINAFTDLQDALSLSVCSNVTEIHVAVGTYKPGTLRHHYFRMRNGVAILGGYPTGGGPRDWVANVTILSGDIGTAGSNSDNSYHVLSNSGLDNTAVLDGFRIEGGNANGVGPYNYGGGMYNYSSSSPTVTNCTFSGNEAYYNGGGMFNYSSSSPTVTNCTFSGNTASQLGGGMCNYSSSSPTVTNCTFSGNSAYYDGGGMCNYSSSSPTVTNCTFSGNTASQLGGGMCNYYSSNPSVMNCTFSGNSAPNGGGMNNISSNLIIKNSIFWNNGTEIVGGGTVTYSIVQGGYTGTGNLNADPLFVNAASGDFHIQPCSPARDAGTASASGVPSTDFEGDARPFGAGIDIGADEETTLWEAFTAPSGSSSSSSFFTTSNAICNDNDGWSHYYNSFYGNLLLSLKIGSSGAVVPENAVTIGVGGGNSAFWVNSVPGNLVNNGDGAAFMKRKWNVAATSQPSSEVGVRFYYTTQEYNAVNDSIQSNSSSPTSLTGHEQMRMFKVLNNSDPWQVGTLAASDGIDLGHGVPSTTSWEYHSFGDQHYAEFYVDAFSGGGGGGASAGAALPIELIYFRGEALEKSNLISWVTASEINSDYHLIERSLDGEVLWEEIGIVPAMGFSEFTTTYEFLDENPAAIGYYRLKTFDFDGSFQISKVIVIKRENLGFELLSVYPVPATNFVKVVFNLPEENQVTLALTDVSGRVITANQHFCNDGRNEVFFDLSTIQPGMYFLQIEDGKKILREKIIKR